MVAYMHPLWTTGSDCYACRVIEKINGSESYYGTCNSFFDPFLTIPFWYSETGVHRTIMYDRRIDSSLTITGSYNGLLPGRRQAIIWTSAVILLIELLAIPISKNLT